MWWGSRKYNGDFLVVDVGSSSIAMGLASRGASGEVRVNNFVRQEIPFQQELTYERFLQNTANIIEKTGLELQKRGVSGNIPIHCVLASPWFSSRSRELIYTPDKPFKVTSNFIDELIKNDIDKFRVETMAKEKIKLGKDAIIFEVKITKVKINGYEISDPIGKSGEVLSVSYFVSMSNSHVHEMFRDILTAVFHHDKIYFHSLPILVVGSLEQISAIPERYLFVDINGEISDIISVVDGFVAEMNSFPLGTNFLARWYGKKLATKKEDIFSTITRINQDNSNKEIKEALMETTEYVKKEWLKNFTKSLEDTAYERNLPRHIYLLTDERLLPVFTEFLKDPMLAKYSFNNKPFNVTPVTKALLGEKIARGLGGPNEFLNSDNFLTFESIFISKV